MGQNHQVFGARSAPLFNLFKLVATPVLRNNASAHQLEHSISYDSPKHQGQTGQHLYYNVTRSFRNQSRLEETIQLPDPLLSFGANDHLLCLKHPQFLGSEFYRSNERTKSRRKYVKFETVAGFWVL